MADLPKREIRELVDGDEARNKILNGADKLYRAVVRTFGPGGYNVIVDMPFGDGVLTRDGVTVARGISGPNKGLKDRYEDKGAQILRQASERTNKVAGDGTTATVVLGFNLFKLAHRRVAAGENGMLIKRELEQDAKRVVEFIKSQSKDAKGHLLEVATVSSGDPAIGELVADTLEDIGAEGGITIREQSYPTLDVEKVNGYYFEKGCFYLNTPVDWADPLVLVTQKSFGSNADVVPLIQHFLDLAKQGEIRKLLIIGDVRAEALQTLVQNTASAQSPFEAVVIPPPAFGDEFRLIAEDIALYVGGEVFTEADNMKEFVARMGTLGTAKLAKINQDRAIILGGGGDGHDITTRASEIKRELDDEANAHKKDRLQNRYSRLVGKIAIVNVGASTTTEMEELRFRVEDAIEAVRSAMADGVLPGGGTMLVRAAETDKSFDRAISPLFAEALEDTFRKLMDNAAQNPEKRLGQVQDAKPGYGFNLREITPEPIDLAKAGIWDATRAIVQTIENATSAVGSLITAAAIVGIEENAGGELRQ